MYDFTEFMTELIKEIMKDCGYDKKLTLIEIHGFQDMDPGEL